jgi:predicted HicB family RNase H-like nuclease
MKFTLEIKDELHTKLKMKAAREKTTIRKIVESLLEKSL